MAGPNYHDAGISTVDYNAYTRSDAWKRKRRAAYNRAGHKCEECGASRCLVEAHHLTYERFGNEADTDIRVLCTPCHALVHGGKKLKRLREKAALMKMPRARAPKTDDVWEERNGAFLAALIAKQEWKPQHPRYRR